jgi:hypothetical protein
MIEGYPHPGCLQKSAQLTENRMVERWKYGVQSAKSAQVTENKLVACKWRPHLQLLGVSKARLLVGQEGVLQVACERWKAHGFRSRISLYHGGQGARQLDSVLRVGLAIQLCSCYQRPASWSFGSGPVSDNATFQDLGYPLRCYCRATPQFRQDVGPCRPPPLPRYLLHAGHRQFQKEKARTETIAIGKDSAKRE